MQPGVAPKTDVGDGNGAPASQSFVTEENIKQQHTPGQTAWLRFVERVEQGKELDYSGQYVAKSTQIPAGAVLTRVKRDAAMADFKQYYKLTADGEVVSVNPKKSNLTNIEECGSCGGGFGTVQSTFTTSVGQGGSGAIFDIKLMYNNVPSSSAVNLNRAGYIMLNADLNKGSGGDYIYFTFTRNSTQALYGPDDPSGPSVGSRAFDTKTEGRFSIGPVPAPPTNFLNIWTPQSPENPAYVNADLNGRAGGKYIWSYQSKNASIYPARFTEVGVLSSNSSTAMPPAGWQRNPQDLNEGCGGDYIYFCYRY